MKHSITTKIFSLCLLLIVFSALCISIPTFFLLKKDKQEASRLRIQVAFDIMSDDSANRIDRQKVQVSEFLQQISAFPWGLSLYDKIERKQDYFSSSTYSSYIITMGEELVRFSRIMDADRLRIYAKDKRLLVTYNKNYDRQNAYAYITTDDSKNIYLKIDTYSQYLIRKRIVDSPAVLDTEPLISGEIPQTITSEYYIDNKQLGLRLWVPVLHNNKSVGTLVVESFFTEELIERYSSLSQTDVNIFAGKKLSIGTLLAQKELSFCNNIPDNVGIRSVTIAGKDYYQGCLAVHDLSNKPVGYITSSLSKRIESTEVRKVLIIVLVLFLLTILVAFGLTIIFSRNTIRFIKELTETTSAFTRGDLEKSIAIRGNDELSLLAMSFLKMRDSINKQINELNNEILERKQTERALRKRETENAALEEQLVQAQKMEAIGTLAGGIAHDFNNILTIILGYADILKRKLPQGESAFEHVKQIAIAGDRAKSLVSQILAFSHQSNKELLPIKPDQIINEVLEMLRASLPTTIAIKKNVKNCGYIIADATQLHQIILNLCTNAYHAMRQSGGVLSVELKREKISPEDVLIKYATLIPGSYLKLTIGDTGHGMDKDTQQKIFDPYFTTKEKGEGTGLGLAVVHGVVKSFGGVVSVSSVEGEGTVFEIVIPEAKFHAEQTRYEENDLVPGGKEHILVVDDEESILVLLREMLEELGYQVTVCNDPETAVRVFAENPNDFSLVISDMTMPNKTGMELIGEIKQIKPEIKIILCTGFSDLIDEEKAKRLGIDQYFMKPIGRYDLAMGVRDVLDS